jgi:hypothetical protein
MASDNALANSDNQSPKDSNTFGHSPEHNHKNKLQLDCSDKNFMVEQE